jgi:hypothetical protein
MFNILTVSEADIVAGIVLIVAGWFLCRFFTDYKD